MSGLKTNAGRRFFGDYSQNQRVCFIWSSVLFASRTKASLLFRRVFLRAQCSWGWLKIFFFSFFARWHNDEPSLGKRTILKPKIHHDLLWPGWLRVFTDIRPCPSYFCYFYNCFQLSRVCVMAIERELNPIWKIHVKASETFSTRVILWLTCLRLTRVICHIIPWFVYFADI